MSTYLFKISRFISIITVFISIVTNSTDGFSYRDMMLLTSVLIFLTVSYIYEKRWGIFGPGYAIYFIVFFLIHNISPYNYIYRYSTYYTLISNPLARIPNDNYGTYFTVFVISSIIIIVQLLMTRKIINNDIKIVNLLNVKEAKKILFTLIFVLIPVAVFAGGIFKTIFIPATSYFFISVIFIKQSRKYWPFKIGLLISVIIIATQITSRYVIVRYLMPIGFSIIFFDYIKFGFKSKAKLKKKALIINGGIFVLMYGVLSEIAKLNKRKGIDLSFDIIFQVFTEFGVLFKWIDRQVYRIFEIWTVLGGNIIDYANSNGFFYGVTYIKSLAPVLGFDYISLPALSASMVGANYAQPGLVAEGYANFGIIGAVVNILSVYFLAEIFQRRFVKKPTLFNLLLIVTPFSSVILDGGTLNAAIFNIVFLIFTFIVSILTKRNYLSKKTLKV